MMLIARHQLVPFIHGQGGCNAGHKPIRHRGRVMNYGPGEERVQVGSVRARRLRRDVT